MEDIAPQLVENVTGEFHRLYDASGKISSLLAKVKAKTATYAEAQEYALEVSRLIGQAWQKYVKADTLPDGKMYYNIASRLIPAVLDENHALVAGYAVEVQKGLNDRAGIGLKAQKAELDGDRVDGLVELASNAERYDQVSGKLLSAFENFSQHTVDETIRKNADLHYNTGLSPKLIRRSNGKCCAWCRSLAGSHDYPDVDRDVYRRHDNCRCTVLYDPADGGKKFQNVHTKKTSDINQHIADYQARQVIRQREDSAKRFKRKFQALPQRNAVSMLRTDAAEWIKSLSDEEKRAIRKYTGNGDARPKLYQRINEMLRGDAAEDKTLRYYAEQISSALKRSTIGQNVICYRGSSVNPFGKADVGSVVSFSQFLSTSVISSRSFDAGVTFTIYVPKGKSGVAYIEELSEYPKQREILFDKDCRYVVLSNKENQVELVVI